MIGFVIGIAAKNSHFLLIPIKMHTIMPSCKPNAALNLCCRHRMHGQTVYGLKILRSPGSILALSTLAT